MNEHKTRNVSYVDPVTNKRVEREIKIPSPANVKTLSCGATVEEIPNMAALEALWAEATCSDLVIPLNYLSRQALANELKKALHDSEDHRAIEALASTWQPPDDIALKVLKRLLVKCQDQEQKRGERMNNNTVQLEHDKAHLTNRLKRMEDENKALVTDVKKLVEERDALHRSQEGAVALAIAQTEARMARMVRMQLKTCDDNLHAIQVRMNQTEAALTQSMNERAALSREIEELRCDANIRLVTAVAAAVADYENEVTRKLTEVAADHNAKAIEVNELREEVSSLKDERNILCNLIEPQAEVSAMRPHLDDGVNMFRSVNITTGTPQTMATLRAGDEVYCKVSGEGPFVLMHQVDEAQIEYANPISNKRNTFAMGRMAVANAWLVRCKDGSYRTFPAPALTTQRPERTFSLVGVKGLVTSDVTARLFQAIIWIAMLTCLFLDRS